MRNRAPTLVVRLVRGVATCRLATSSGMKSLLKRWSFKKLHPRRRSGHEDPQTLEHVKEAFRQNVTSVLHERLPTNTEDWVALSVPLSQDRHNEATASAKVPMMSENLADAAKDRSENSQRMQTSSKSDESPIYTQITTRVESPPLSIGLSHDIQVPENSQSSPNYDPQRSHGELKRSDSPSLIRKFPPEETTPERLDNPGFTADEDDHLGHFGDDIYHTELILTRSDRSESISHVEDCPEAGLHLPDHPQPKLDQQGYLEQGYRHSKSITSRQTHEVLVSDGPDHSKFIWERPYAQSMLPDERDLSKPIPHGRDHLERIPNQELHSEPIWERQDDSRHDSDGQDPDSIIKKPDHPAPILVWPHHTELIPQGEHHPESSSHHQDLISDRQSRPESFRSQKSFMAKDQRRRLRREARLHNLLSRNLQTRARAYEKRSQLCQSRSEISNADEAFMKLIRERRFQGSEDDAVLHASFKRLQDARDRHGPLEETYNTIEEQLNREEYETKEFEAKILKSEISAADFDIDSRSSSVSDDDSKASEIVGENYHPLYEAYLSRLGDADLCHEAIAELMIEHDNLLQAQESRQGVGMELSPDDQLTLGNFPAAETKLLNELRRIDEDVELLRLECVREGLVDEKEKENQNEVQLEVQDEGGGNDEEIDLAQTLTGSLEQEQTEYTKYPILLEKPGEKEDENKSKVLLTDFKEGDVGDRITCWLLHKLRTSGLEVELLARYTDGLDHNVDTANKWQEEVLEFWFFDDTNLPPSAYQVEPSLTAFPASHISDLNQGSHKRFGDTTRT